MGLWFLRLRAKFQLNFTCFGLVVANFNIDKILPLIQHGHIHYGENKVQEAVEKWTEIKKTNSKDV